MPYECDDFKGPCCASCHVDEDAGGERWGIEVMRGAELYAVVCCDKEPAAIARRDGLPPPKAERSENDDVDDRA